MRILTSVGIVLVILLAGCTKSSTGPGSGIDLVTGYPTGVGSTWSYQHTNTMDNFRPSYPGATYTPDTSVGIITVTVTKSVRLASGSGVAGDSSTTFEFQQTEHLMPPISVASVGYQYFASDSKGLYLHGYRGGGGLSLPRAVPDGPQLVINGIHFRSVRELIDAILLPPESPNADSIVRQIPPLLTLQFPLIIGDSWIYRRTGNPWGIEKRVLSDTALAVSGASYHCYVVRWIFDMDNNGVPDQNIWIDDFIAQEGLLRRTITVKDITIATSENPEGIGVIDSRSDYIGTGVIIR